MSKFSKILGLLVMFTLLLTAAAFLSMLLPMIGLFSLQCYFVRGMLAAVVKG
jgi:ABC-type glycerol-3-phosphate transport system permease component